MATSSIEQAIRNSILTTTTGAGLESQTPTEAAMAQMNALDLLNAYGAPQRSDAVNDFANLMGTSRTTAQTAGDLLNSTTQGVIGGLGGLGSLIAAPVDFVADTNFAGGITDLTTGINQGIDPWRSDTALARGQLFGQMRELRERDSEQRFQQDKEKSGSFVASLKQVGRDAIQAVDDHTSNEYALTEGTGQAIGSIATAGPIGKGVTAIGRGIFKPAIESAIKKEAGVLARNAGTQVTSDILRKAEEEVLKKAYIRGTTASMAGQEAGGAFQDTYNKAIGMPDEVWEANPEYQERRKVIGDTAAKAEIANDVASKAALITLPAAIAAARIAAPFEANPLSRGVRRAAQDTLVKEPMEESLQGLNQAITGNYALQDIDPNIHLSSGAGEGLGTGALYGAMGAGLFSGAGIATSPMQVASEVFKGKLTPTTSTEVPTVTPTETIKNTGLVSEVLNSAKEQPIQEPEDNTSGIDYNQEYSEDLNIASTSIIEAGKDQHESLGVNLTDEELASGNAADIIVKQLYSKLEDTNTSVEDASKALALLDSKLDAFQQVQFRNLDHPEVSKAVSNTSDYIKSIRQSEPYRKALQRVQKDFTASPMTSFNSPKGKPTLGKINEAKQRLKLNIGSIDATAAKQILKYASTNDGSFSKEETDLLSALVRSDFYKTDVSEQITTGEGKNAQGKESVFGHLRNLQQSIATGKESTSFKDLSNWSEIQAKKVKALFKSKETGKPVKYTKDREVVYRNEDFLKSVVNDLVLIARATNYSATLLGNTDVYLSLDKLIKDENVYKQVLNTFKESRREVNESLGKENTEVVDSKESSKDEYFGLIRSLLKNNRSYINLASYLNTLITSSFGDKVSYVLQDKVANSTTSEGVDAKVEFKGTKATIYYSKDSSLEDLLHELVHVVVHNKLNKTGTSWSRESERILNQIRENKDTFLEKYPNTTVTAFDNVHEMYAWALTNDAFKQWLNEQVSTKPADIKPKGGLHRLYQLVMRMLGVTKENNGSVYAELVHLFSKNTANTKKDSVLTAIKNTVYDRLIKDRKASPDSTDKDLLIYGKDDKLFFEDGFEEFDTKAEAKKFADALGDATVVKGETGYVVKHISDKQSLSRQSAGKRLSRKSYYGEDVEPDSLLEALLDKGGIHPTFNVGEGKNLTDGKTKTGNARYGNTYLVNSNGMTRGDFDVWGTTLATKFTPNDGRSFEDMGPEDILAYIAANPNQLSNRAIEEQAQRDFEDRYREYMEEQEEIPEEEVVEDTSVEAPESTQEAPKEETKAIPPETKQTAPEASNEVEEVNEESTETTSLDKDREQLTTVGFVVKQNTEANPIVLEKVVETLKDELTDKQFSEFQKVVNHINERITKVEEAIGKSGNDLYKGFLGQDGKFTELAKLAITNAILHASSKLQVEQSYDDTVDFVRSLGDISNFKQAVKALKGTYNRYTFSDEISRVLMKSFGVSLDPKAPLAPTMSQMTALAHSILGATASIKTVYIDPEGELLTVKKDNNKTYTNVSVYSKPNSILGNLNLTTLASKFNQAISGEVTNRTFYGNEDVPLHPDSVKVSNNPEEDAKVLKAMSIAKHRVNTKMDTLLTSIGVDKLVSIFYPVSSFIYESKKDSVEAASGAIAQAFNKMTEIRTNLSKLGEGYQFVRYQYIQYTNARYGISDPINPQNNKFMRAFLTTAPEVEVNPENWNEVLPIAYAVLQTLGVKVNKKNEDGIKAEWVKLNELASEGSEHAVRKLIRWVNKPSSLDGVTVSGLFKEASKTYGDIHSPLGLKALVTLLDYRKGITTGKFTTSITVESDGITNGPSGAMFMAAHRITDTFLRQMYRAGVAFLSTDEMKNDYVKYISEDSTDNYGETALNLTKELNAATESESIKNVLKLLTLISSNGSDIQVSESKGSYIVESISRAFVKNPTTTKIYGAGLPAFISNLSNYIVDTIVDNNRVFSKSEVNTLTQIFNEYTKDTNIKVGFIAHRDGYLIDTNSLEFFLKVKGDSFLKEFIEIFQSAINNNFGVDVSTNIDDMIELTNTQYEIFLQAYRADLHTLKKAKGLNGITKGDLDGLFKKHRHLLPKITSHSFITNALREIEHDIDEDMEKSIAVSTVFGTTDFKQSMPIAGGSLGVGMVSKMVQASTDAAAIKGTVLAILNDIANEPNREKRNALKKLLENINYVHDGFDVSPTTVNDIAKYLNNALFESWINTDISSINYELAKRLSDDFGVVLPNHLEELKQQSESSKIMRETLRKVPVNVTQFQGILLDNLIPVDGGITIEEAQEIFEDQIYDEVDVEETVPIRGNTAHEVLTIAGQNAEGTLKKFLDRLNSSAKLVNRMKKVGIAKVKASARSFYEPVKDLIYLREVFDQHLSSDAVHEVTHALTHPAIAAFYNKVRLPESISNNIGSVESLMISSLKNISVSTLGTSHVNSLNNLLDVLSDAVGSGRPDGLTPIYKTSKAKKRKSGNRAITEDTQSGLYYHTTLQGVIDSFLDTFESATPDQKAEAISEFLTMVSTDETLSSIFDENVRDELVKWVLRSLHITLNKGETYTSAIRRIAIRIAEDSINMQGDLYEPIRSNLPNASTVYMFRSDLAQKTIDSLSSALNAYASTESLDNFVEQGATFEKDLLDKNARNEAGIRLAKHLNDKVGELVGSGFLKNPEELEAFKILYGTLLTARNQNHQAINAIGSLLGSTAWELKQEDFGDINDPVIYHNASTKIGFLENLPEGKNSSLLFFALASTDSELRLALDKVKITPESFKTEIEGTTLDQKLNGLGDRFYGFLTNLYQGKTDPSVLKNLDSIKEMLYLSNKSLSMMAANAETSGLSLISSMETQFKTALDKATDVVIDALPKGNKVTATAADAISIISNYAKDGNLLAEDLLKWSHSNERIPNFIKSLAKDLTMNTEDNADVLAQIKKINFKVGRLRSLYKKQIPTNIRTKFTKRLSTSELAAMRDVLGKSNVVAVSGNDLTEIGKLLDPKYRSNKLNSLGLTVQETSIANALSNYNMTGDIKAGFKNAKPTPRIIEAASYMSLGLVSKPMIKEMSSLIQNEQAGVKELTHHINRFTGGGLKRTSMRRLGYSLQEPAYRHSLRLVENTGIDDAQRHGYTVVKPHPQLKGYTIMRSNVSGKPGYNQGILQSVTERQKNHTGNEILRVTEKTDPVLYSKLSEGNYDNVIKDGDVYVVSVNDEMFNLVNPSSNIIDMIGSTYGRYIEESLAEFINNESLLKIKAMYDKPGVDKSRFVNVMDSEFLDEADPVMKDSLSILNNNLKDKIGEVFGEGEFWIRKDLLSDVLGERKADITDFWSGVSRWSPETRKHVRNILETLLGKDAYKYAVRSSEVLASIVQEAKVIIIVKSGVVSAANTLGNIGHMMINGIPLTHIAKEVPKLIQESLMYERLEGLAIELKTKIRTSDVSAQERAKLQVQLNNVKARQKSLRIWPLIVAGEFGSINDSLDMADTKEMFSDFTSWMGKKVDDSPELLKTAVKNIVMTKDTAVFKAMQKSVDYGDFISKVLIYEKSLTEGMTKEQALIRVSDEFVNYDRLRGRDRQAFETYGLAWFWGYKLRIAKIALRTIRKHPVKALLMAALPVDIDLPVTDNVFTKGIEGTLPYSLGPGMGIRAFGMNPVENLLF